MKSLWDDLGVTESFKNNFLALSSELSNTDFKEFLDYEINQLTKLASNLSKLSKEVEAREKTLELITQFCENLKTKEVTAKLITDIVHVLKNLRVLSINIINYYGKIRDQSSYFILGGKYKLENLNKSFNFNVNYLMKLKNDTDFLRHSNLKNYFNFSDNSDPFLLELAKNKEEKDEM